VVNKGDIIMEKEITFAGFLKEIMLKRNMKQKELAAKVGISQQAISVYLGGNKKPTVSTIHKIARGLKLDVDSLLKYAGDPRKDNPAKGLKFALSTDENYIISVFRDLPEAEKLNVITHVTELRAKVLQSGSSGKTPAT
jgi:transcriptional regulator with XRE-family HTH domain